MEIGSILLKKILCGKFWEDEKNNKLYSRISHFMAQVFERCQEMPETSNRKPLTLEKGNEIQSATTWNPRTRSMR